MDKVHGALRRKVTVYVTWTADLRFSWKRRLGRAFVGCYVRWHEKGSPAGIGPAVYFCSDRVGGFDSALGLERLRAPYWKRYIGCRHYKALKTAEDTSVASEAVEKLYKLTA